MAFFELEQIHDFSKTKIICYILFSKANKRILLDSL